MIRFNAATQERKRTRDVVSISFLPDSHPSCFFCETRLNANWFLRFPHIVPFLSSPFCIRNLFSSASKPIFPKQLRYYCPAEVYICRDISPRRRGERKCSGLKKKSYVIKSTILLHILNSL